MTPSFLTIPRTNSLRLFDGFLCEPGAISRGPLLQELYIVRDQRQDLSLSRSKESLRGEDHRYPSIESLVTGDHAFGAGPFQNLIQQVAAAAQGAQESFLFEGQNLGDSRLGLNSPDNRAPWNGPAPAKFATKGLVGPQDPAIADGAAQELPLTHSPVVDIGGLNPIRDGKREAAQMVGNHAERSHLILSQVRFFRVDAEDLFDFTEDAPDTSVSNTESTSIFKLTKPLKPRAGVDRRFRQGIKPALLIAVKLHEDQVPKLQETLAGGIFQRISGVSVALSPIIE